jgi:small subunit ribosomal protein S16
LAVKLRLMRMGKKKQPTYRVVAADSRSPRNGRFIEIIGIYEPRQDPSVVRIDNERALHWLRHGAQPTERVEKLLKISGAWEDFRGAADPVTAAAGSAEESDS